MTELGAISDCYIHDFDMEEHEVKLLEAGTTSTIASSERESPEANVSDEISRKRTER